MFPKLHGIYIFFQNTIRITRKLSPFGTCHLKIIARNKSYLQGKFVCFVCSVLIQVRYSRLQLLFVDQEPHTVPEAYHLEAYNSDPMLGFFSEPIKFYFLIWNIAHCTSRYSLLCGSNGGRFVLLVVCRFLTFFRAHQENQTIVFLELLVQYQA